MYIPSGKTGSSEDKWLTTWMTTWNCIKLIVAKQPECVNNFFKIVARGPVWWQSTSKVTFSGTDIYMSRLLLQSTSSTVILGVHLFKEAWIDALKSSMSFFMSDCIFAKSISFLDSMTTPDSAIFSLDLSEKINIILSFKEVSIEHLQRVRLANRGRLLLRVPGPVYFGLTFVLMLRPFAPEIVVSELWISNIPIPFILIRWTK